MSEPYMEDKCVMCDHTYGEHYVSNNGMKTGCAIWYEGDERYGGGRSDCNCKGFAVIYKPA